MLEGKIIDGGDGPSLLAWARLGIADERVHSIGTYFGGGVTFGADAKRLGIAIAHARLGKPPRRTTDIRNIAPRPAETAIEISYAHSLNDRISIQPNIQYVVDPDGIRIPGTRW